MISLGITVVFGALAVVLGWLLDEPSRRRARRAQSWARKNRAEKDAMYAQRPRGMADSGGICVKSE